MKPEDLEKQQAEFNDAAKEAFAEDDEPRSGVRVSGGATKSEMPGGVKVTSGGGELKLNQKLDGKSSVGAGVRGYAYRVKGDGFKDSGAAVTGGEINYRKSNTEVGVDYDKDAKRVTLKLRKEF